MPKGVADAMIKLEAQSMASLERHSTEQLQGIVLRWDRMATWAESGAGELIGFAITSADEGRGKAAKLLVWELHVRPQEQRKGLATALLDLVQMKSSLTRGRQSVLIELKVHATNEAARAFCQHYGFVEAREGQEAPILRMCCKK